MRYSNLEFHTARRAKGEAGRIEHRQKIGDPFVGDVFEEIFGECLDLYNYFEEAERQTGKNFFLFRMLAQFIGRFAKSAGEKTKRAPG